MHCSFSNNKAQSKSLAGLRDVFQAQINYYFCPAPAQAVLISVLIVAAMERNVPERELKCLLLLRGESSDKFTLSLVWMQAENEQESWDLANLSAVLVCGLWFAPLDAVDMLFQCCRCQDELFPLSLLLLILFQQPLVSVSVREGLKHTRLLKGFYILYVNAC